MKTNRFLFLILIAILSSCGPGPMDYTPNLFQPNKNYSLETAIPLETEDSLICFIDPDSPTVDDFFSFEIPKAGLLILTLEFPAYSYFFASVLDENGLCLAAKRSEDDDTSYQLFYQMQEQDTGILYIAVNGFPIPFDENIKVHIHLDTSDPLEFNNNIQNATPVNFNDTISTILYPLNDVDFYSFTLDHDTVVEIAIDSNYTSIIKLPGSVDIITGDDIYLTVLDAQNKKLFSSHIEGTRLKPYTYEQYLPAGKYFFKIGNYDPLFEITGENVFYTTRIRLKPELSSIILAP